MQIAYSRKYRVIIQLTAICWIISKLLCLKLWLADRSFPLVPVIEGMRVPTAFHLFLFIAGLVVMVAIILFPAKKLAALLCLIEIAACLLDQNRWQPWEYQFIFMMASFAFAREENSLRLSWQIIFSGLYFFSGLGKLNSAFIHDTWQYLVLHRWLDITVTSEWALRAGYAIPLIEMAAAIMLWLTPLRKFAVYVLCAMHIFILFLLGPFGLHINSVVWPWNLFMPVLLYLLFREPIPTRQKQFRPGIAVVLVFWWLLPWLGRWGGWDRYLSFGLYSGGVPQLVICTDQKAVDSILQNDKTTNSRIPCSPLLPVFDWGMKEMNSAPYPETRVYRAIAREWNARYPNSQNRFFITTSGFQYKVVELKP